MSEKAPAAALPPAVPVEDGAGHVEPASLPRLQLSPLALLCVLAVIAALYLARSFFVPLFMGILISYTLYPLVDWLQRLRIPRAIGAALVLSILLGGTGTMVMSLRDDAQKVVDSLPGMMKSLRQRITSPRQSGPTPLQQVGRAAEEIQRMAAEAAGVPARTSPTSPPPLTWLRDYAVAQSGLFVAIIAQTPFVLLLAYFLLASGEHFRRKLIRVAGPTLSQKKVTLQILNDIDGQVQRYMLSMIITNLLVGAGTWLAFLILGMQLPGLWGVAAGLLHFIPYLGPIIIAVASGIAGTVQFDSLLHGLAAAGSTLLVATLAGMVFMTWLQSRFSRTNPAVLFIVLLFFGWLWGAWGLLLGAPLLAIIKVVCDRVEDLKPVGELLGR